MHICQYQSPNSFHPTPVGIHVCSLHLFLYFCFANKIIYTIFLDSTHMHLYTMFFSFLLTSLCIQSVGPPMSLSSVQFSSVAKSCPTLCDPMNRSTPGLPVLHQLPEFTPTHVHWVGDAIQPSHPLSSPSPPAPSLSQCQSLFQWVNSSHEVAKVLEFQL